VQAEVADRMTAPPGSRVYGVPSVKLAWYADSRRAGPVPRTVFWPVPNVDSGLVAFTRRDPPAVDVPRAEVFAVVDAAFSQRRKTLRNSLRRFLSEPDFGVLAIAPATRAQELGVKQFVAIADYVGSRAAQAD
jgi:16S rRNA (adenine1518-N6/adenine1519-N6)-dimethyltransferase